MRTSARPYWKEIAFRLRNFFSYPIPEEQLRSVLQLGKTLGLREAEARLGKRRNTCPYCGTELFPMTANGYSVFACPMRFGKDHPQTHSGPLPSFSHPLPPMRVHHQSSGPLLISPIRAKAAHLAAVSRVSGPITPPLGVDRVPRVQVTEEESALIGLQRLAAGAVTGESPTDHLPVVVLQSRARARLLNP